ncbi:MAG: sigma-70 family RNA polymerase sigma factor [Acidobacteriaceae bacterium]
MRPELIRATELLQAKDPASVNEALGLLQGAVYAFSMKVCGHSEDAEDTAQEVFVRSLPHLAKISEPKALAVWLYTVARNRCWRMRRKSAYAPTQMLSLSELMPGEMELGELLQDGGPTPEMQATQAQQSQRLQEAVWTLPPTYRIVLVLHDMEDLETEEVAQVLGIQQGTVRVRLHRARLFVRKALAAAEVRREEVVNEGVGRAGRLRKVGSARGKPRECTEIFANLSEYMDGRVESVACERMREHIEGCRPCVAFIQDLRAAIDRCRMLESPCAPETGQRLRSLLTQEYMRLVGQEAAGVSVS